LGKNQDSCRGEPGKKNILKNKKKSFSEFCTDRSLGDRNKLISCTVGKVKNYKESCKVELVMKVLPKTSQQP